MSGLGNNTVRLCDTGALGVMLSGRAASKPFISSIDQQGSGNVLRVTWHGAEKNAVSGIASNVLSAVCVQILDCTRSV